MLPYIFMAEKLVDSPHLWELEAAGRLSSVAFCLGSTAKEDGAYPCAPHPHWLQWRQRGFAHDITTTLSPTGLGCRSACCYCRVCRPARTRRPLHGHRKPAQEPDRGAEDRHHRRQHHLSVASARQGDVAWLSQPQILE